MVDSGTSTRIHCRLPHTHRRLPQPATVFLMNAFIVGISTAVADVARRTFDNDGSNHGTGFVVYLTCVMGVMMGVHVTLYETTGWGGGMLASKNQVRFASQRFFWTGVEDWSAEEARANTIGDAMLLA